MRHLSSGLVGRVAKLAVGAVVAATVGTAATAGITTSRHNLGTTAGNPGTNKLLAGGTAEICVFCHTPHAADVSVAGVPLWNKRLATGATYTVYNSSTLDAAKATDGLAGGSIGSVSLACLSCHDGTQAMDNILNTPGSGTTTGTTGGGTNGATGATWTWNTTGSTVSAEGILQSTTIAMLGSDLSNDHPIGIRYCGGGPTQAAPTTACADADFIAPANGTLGGSTVLWVNTTGGTAAREKQDMILFNRSFGGTIAPSVECASCHDPHNPTNGTFLRISNAGSAVCLACHNK